MVPREYSNQCIVTQTTRYTVSPEAHSGPHTRDGILDVGRVVWTRDPLMDAMVNRDATLKPDQCVPAWVQGIGEIGIDPTHLKPF